MSSMIFLVAFCAQIATLKAVDTHAQQTLPFIFFVLN